MRLLLALAVAVVVAGCSDGRDCSGLAASTAERDAARAAYLELARGQAAGGPATAEQVELADDRLHDLERRHAELAAACAR